MPLVNSPYFDIPVVDEYFVEPYKNGYKVSVSNIKTHRVRVMDMPSVDGYSDVLLSSMLGLLKERIEIETKGEDVIDVTE